MKWRIGCSGFHYKEWKETFYPKNIAQTKWFEYYCTHFNTIELNTTFYRFPRIDTLRSYYKKSPEDFAFSVKAPRLITHYKNFNDCQRLLGDFYGSVYEGLGDKLGCILFQLPSRLPYSEELLDRIINILDPSFDNVIEFRDATWWKKKIYNKLKKHSITFCGVSFPKLTEQAVNNHPILYYRFHGVPVLYKSEYEKKFLNKIMSEIKATKAEQAYIYFNNTWGTGAITNAKQMQKFIK